MTEFLPAAQPIEDDPQREAAVDAIVARHWPGGIRRTPATGEGSTRVDCTEEAPSVLREVGARWHQSGRGGGE